MMHGYWKQRSTIYEKIIPVNKIFPQNPKASSSEPAAISRDVIFISKGTPNDDEFALWLAPRLEAAGYFVFTDILCLQAGDRWRRELTETLQNRAVKMLLCCSDSTLARNGVQEEIDIAEDLAKELPDTNFIIPLKLEKFKKVFGIGGLQYIDFENGWAKGLAVLLDQLEGHNVPKNNEFLSINPNWEGYKKRQSLEISHFPEGLTSNWLRITDLPDTIRFFEPTGAISIGAFEGTCKNAGFPLHFHNRGVFSFMNLEEITPIFAAVAPLEVIQEVSILKFIAEGSTALNVKQREASNIAMSMFRDAWQKYCRSRGLLEYLYSKQPGYHAGDEQLAIGKKVPWGRQGTRRSAMLRNIAKGKVWQFGVSAAPVLWPYPHFRLKSRVLFSDVSDGKAGALVDGVDQQFRCRRSICKGWRNKQWHGRLMAFLEMLSGESAFLKLPLGPSSEIRLDATPILFTSPVSTLLPDVLTDDDEETDPSVLGHERTELEE